MPEQVQIIRWEEPPPVRVVTSGRGRRGSRFDKVAADLQIHPGRWALIHESGNVNSSNAVAATVRCARVVCFEPRGDFDAVCRSAGEGRYRVYARYVGDGGES